MAQHPRFFLAPSRTACAGKRESSRSATVRLALISLLSEQARHELERDTERIDMLSLAGLGAELWKQIDIDTYLDQERASWERC